MTFLPSDHPPVASPKVGVLLVNLGTPEAPTPGAVKTYLREFLSDRRVVEIPPLLWQPILRGIILNVRPRKSAHAYSLVWDKARDMSPLKAVTEDQAAALNTAFGADVLVDYAMRYGKPAIRDRLEAMKAAGCTRILVAPLYPQYSGATTATVVDEVGRALSQMRWQPTVRFLPPYYDDPAHIEALRDSVDAGLAGLDFTPDAIVASFHGMPMRTLELGDPYHCQCQKTGRLLAEALGREVQVSFQSRFGRAKWLEPATDFLLEELPKRGIRSVVIVAPGFSADCLETLEEIAIRGRETFIAAGGTDFAYLPCLNASSAGVKMLRNLLFRELAGWIATP